MSNLVGAVCGYGWRAKNVVSSLFVSLCKVGILLYALNSAVSLKWNCDLKNAGGII